MRKPGVIKADGHESVCGDLGTANHDRAEIHFDELVDIVA
jgi:hypothetical protein